MLKEKESIEKEVFSIKGKLEEIMKSLDLEKPEHVIMYGKIKRYLLEIKEIIIDELMLDDIFLATAQEIENELKKSDLFNYDINAEFVKLIQIQNVHKPDKWLLQLQPVESI